MKCDFLLKDEVLFSFAELKGQDIQKAVEQIENTYFRLHPYPKKSSFKSYVIGTRVPKGGTAVQSMILKHKKKIGSDLIVKTIYHEVII